MKISVIIPIYNEEKVVEDCLSSLSRQTYKDLEIVVVDDGSTDKTISRVTSHKLRVTLLRQQHKGPGEARNLGVKDAKGEILVFVDSDMTFEPDFVEKLVAPIAEGKAKGTFSKEEFVSNPQNIWSQCWGIDEGWEEGRRHPRNYPDTQKVFRAILKSEFDKVGGFSKEGYTDDWTLSEKLGYQAVAAPDAKFYHKNPESLTEVFQQARWIGKRKYKLGTIGIFVALVRTSLSISLVVGVFKSVWYQKPAFLIFKTVYDFGAFVGATESLFGGSSAK
ncbi:MAG: glycosyltransferase family 2 protein [bacterium]|nr:glycosyltransferase family 2 protein [bacterium]